MNLILENLKTRNRAFTISITISIVVLILIAPIMFQPISFMRIFSIGYFRTGREYRVPYGNEYIGIYVELDISLRRFEDIGTDIGYFVETTVSLRSSANVEPSGFIYREQRHLNGESLVELEQNTFNPPVSIVAMSTGFIMGKGSVCNSTGTVEAQFVLSSVVYNETLNYQLNYIIPYDNLDYQNFNLLFSALFIFYLVSFVVIPLTLYKVFKPMFGIKFDEIDIEREKRFREYTKKKSEKE